jgi:hypothetical protein
MGERMNKILSMLRLKPRSIANGKLRDVKNKSTDGEEDHCEHCYTTRPNTNGAVVIIGELEEDRLKYEGQSKTDGAVLIIGEVADSGIADMMCNMGELAAQFYIADPMLHRRILFKVLEENPELSEVPLDQVKATLAETDKYRPQ